MTKYISKERIVFLFILLLAAFLRFINLDWDQGQHLHPDERFLTMVVNKITIPKWFNEYLNPSLSSLNPVNNGFDFFVYGLFPLTIAKFFAVWTNNDTYATFTVLGRCISAFFDLIAVILVYKIVDLLGKHSKLHHHTKYYAMFFYAIAVLPIQLSHFYASDTFLNTLFLFSVFFILKFYYFSSYASLIGSGIFYGLAFSSKVSAIYGAPLIGFFLFFGLVKKSFKDKKNILYLLTSTFLTTILFSISCYFTVRIANPYMFSSANLFDPRINPQFFESLKMLKSWEGYDTWFPPAIQWINKMPVLFSLINMAIFGIGIPYFLLVLAGIAYVLTKKRKSILFILVFWFLGIFIYQSIQFVKVMRYFIFLYPFLALLSAIGFQHHLQKQKNMIKGTILFICFLWPLSFISIYLHPHSRVTASTWIYANIPNNSILLSEYWDDALPLPIMSQSKHFFVEQLHVFDPDTSEKWHEMERLLYQADYYILSSNRAWGSISTVPEKYPRMSKFYKDLFAGKTQYMKVHEITSYPSLSYLGIPITFIDDWSDESFTVYDHPKVIIFKNVAK